MKITYLKTDNFRDAIINSIIALMQENGYNKLMLIDSVFETRGNWKGLVIKNNKLLIIHRDPIPGGDDFLHDFTYVTTVDIINLQKVVYDYIANDFSEIINDDNTF